MTTLRVDYEELGITDDHLTVTCNGQPFTGIACEYNDQGKLISEVSFVDGIEHGVDREWYSSGQLMSERYIVWGGLHGVSREWFDTGCLKIEMYYEHAILVQKKEWDENGNLIFEKHISEEDSLYKVLMKRRKRNL